MQYPDSLGDVDCNSTMVSWQVVMTWLPSTWALDGRPGTTYRTIRSRVGPQPPSAPVASTVGSGPAEVVTTAGALDTGEAGATGCADLPAAADALGITGATDLAATGFWSLGCPPWTMALQPPTRTRPPTTPRMIFLAFDFGLTGAGPDGGCAQECLLGVTRVLIADPVGADQRATQG
ncbi:hypothetical protein C7C46_30985 [Streptomyces tateyamensis]|uniref:Uncharacterized protein n=1 Tax=Streptomyces tateyamensis TaxID=565073 RepID=A0A2V4NXQ6_9ACTN|nr:hypothetical protein C7C46_30985 [Streptomyces tateyamensis]